MATLPHLIAILSRLQVKIMTLSLGNMALSDKLTSLCGCLY